MAIKLPDDFTKKYDSLLGIERSKGFFTSLMSDNSTSGFRLNPTKDDFKNVAEDLTDSIEYCDVGYYGKVDGNSIDHISGYVYSQEPSAMYVAEVAQVQPNDIVLDLCAAPGGKSTQVAAKLTKGKLVANEINRSRAKILSSNVERMGLTNTLVTNNSPEDLSKVYPEYFDKILVDAPCSGEGMFRKDPDAIDYWSEEYVKTCAKRQKEILKDAYKMLKPGGVLIYSTCTFSPEEDEQNVEYMLTKYDDLSVDPIKKYDGMEDGRPEWSLNGDQSLNGTCRMFPDKFKGEGHFISRLLKAVPDDYQEPKNKVKSQKSSVNKNQSELLEEFMMSTFNELNLENIDVKKEIAEAKAFSDTPNRIKILRNGLTLGTFKKNRFEPNHALALAISIDKFKKVFDLDTENFNKYKHGETIDVDDSFEGWVGISYQNKIFSWGKIKKGVVKNFYPKGLRK